MTHGTEAPTRRARQEPERRRYALVDELNGEWRCLVDQTSEAVQRWASTHAPLMGCHRVDDVLDAVRSRPDPVLGALVAEAGRGDVVAGRVVLQAMLGKLVRMAQVDAQAEVDDYVAALWGRIRCYPLASRPLHIASNLALDTLKAVHAERPHRSRVQVLPWPPEELGDLIDSEARDVSGPLPAEAHLSVERVLSAARAANLLTSETAGLLVSVYGEGLSGAQAAVRHGTTPGSVRVRCSRAVRVLAQHSAVLADVA
ncbi:MAG: sigma-70 family polymerase sigma factor [Friedmanniella sp.]|nr:sigma-70 family polymerase sigma factor [Friedmanniella sp.]